MLRHSFHHLPFYGNKADAIIKSYSADEEKIMGILMPPSPNESFDAFSP